MSLIKELAKKLIDENPPEAPKDHDAERLKRLAEIKDIFKKHREKTAQSTNNSTGARARHANIKS